MNVSYVNDKLCGVHNKRATNKQNINIIVTRRFWIIERLWRRKWNVVGGFNDDNDGLW